MSQLLEDTKELFSSLQLRAISHDWIEETWSVNFSDEVALPIEALEGLQSYEAWQCALEICHRWTQSNDSEEEGARLCLVFSESVMQVEIQRSH